MIYALIKNGIIENTIVADANFISIIENNWDSCIRIDELDPMPGISWTYDGNNFSEPIIEEPPPEE